MQGDSAFSPDLTSDERGVKRDPHRREIAGRTLDTCADVTLSRRGLCLNLTRNAYWIVDPRRRVRRCQTWNMR
jgi:hypothetical protein